ncbi:MAG: DUF2179 domain-containing protein [Candidatus Hadarchaeaceae archaeon]
MEETILWTLLIFLARLTDVSMGTLRTILLIRGRRGIAAFSAFFEIMVWVLAVSRVITQLDRWYYLIAFAFGFASGNYLGSYMEEKIAMGYCFAYVVPSQKQTKLAEILRKKGFGVTLVKGEGLKGTEFVYNIVLRRRDTHRLLKILEAEDKSAFYTIMDVHALHGGYMRGANKRKI